MITLIVKNCKVLTAQKNRGSFPSERAVKNQQQNERKASMNETKQLPTMVSLAAGFAITTNIKDYVVPAPDKEITLLHESDTEGSPKTRVMKVLRLRLKRGNVVPTHIHEAKEKVYISVGGACRVFMVVDGEKKQFILGAISSTLVVPPATPHGMYCESENCEILVIISSKDDGDIRWEEATPL